MRYLILISLLLLSLHTISQESAKKEKKPVKASFTISAETNYRSLKGENTASNNIIINNRNGLEKNKPSFTTGIILKFPTSKILEFQTGLLYAGKGYQTEKFSLIFVQPDPNGATATVLKYQFHYLEIPSLLSTSLVKTKKISLFISAGLHNGFLIKAATKTINFYNNGEETRKTVATTNDFSMWACSGVINLGVSYKMNEDLQIAVAPVYKYQLNHLKTNTPLKEKLWSFGLQIVLAKP